LGNEEYARREQAAHELEPLLRQRYYKKIRDAQDVLTSFAMAGFFDDKIRASKDKESTLLMRDSDDMDDSDGSWTPYRFVLKGKYLYYYLATKAKQPHHDYRVIPLKYCAVNWKEEAEEDGSYIFAIVTPVVTYTLKAKHRVAMEEWIEAISRSRNSLGRKKGVKLSNHNGDHEDSFGFADSENLIDAHDTEQPDISNSLSHGHHKGMTPIDPVADKPYLEILKLSSKKPKVYKITKTVTTLGRSSTNDIRVDDSRISREHARIDTIDNKLVLVDLGSKRGSKLNHHMLRERQVLYPNDLIKVGRTLITVRVSRK